MIGEIKMIEKARLKIEEELKNSKNLALTEIGTYLLKQLEINQYQLEQ